MLINDYLFFADNSRSLSFFTPNMRVIRAENKSVEELRILHILDPNPKHHFHLCQRTFALFANNSSVGEKQTAQPLHLSAKSSSKKSSKVPLREHKHTRQLFSTHVSVLSVNKGMTSIFKNLRKDFSHWKRTLQQRQRGSP